jgi:pSer/pThr/pTyr-binding forkhead associated (FHA) protein
MPATLTYYAPGHGGGHLLELGVESILIGRIADCDVRVKDETVTRGHARIDHEDGRYWVTDLGSDNGTYVNGRRIEGAQVLEHRDQLQCGRLRLEFFAS